MYRWISVDRLVNRVTSKDKLFGGKYLIDPYQKCDISCLYCDAAEDTVYIKYNSPSILEKEIESLERGTIIIGSATDPYQIIESRTQLTREILKILIEYDLPIHVLTKSNLVERDTDILKDGNARITLSISTLDEDISKLLEPNAPLPYRRLEAINKLSNSEIEVGIAVFPIIPFITEQHLEDIIRLSKEAGAKYVIYEYLELKGDVKDRFLHAMDGYSKRIADKLREIYHDSYKPKGYSIDEKIRKPCKDYGLRIVNE